ncbi:hypothetical protein ACTGW9_05520, partial [Streptococcus suis]
MKRIFSIYRYIDKKQKWLVIIGRFVNGGVVLVQPLVLSKILQLDKHGLSYGKIWQLLVYGLSVYFVVYSFMLLANHAHNVFRREIQNGIRSSLFRKVIANPKFSQNDKITLLTQDMEVLGDTYLEPINTALSWAFVTLVTSIYILMQDFMLGAIFYHLSSPSRYLTKNILSLVIQIKKLFYFGLKFSVKSVYKSNT